MQQPSILHAQIADLAPWRSQDCVDAAIDVRLHLNQPRVAKHLTNALALTVLELHVAGHVAN